jgi:AcrR family transcriptional regulator
MAGADRRAAILEAAKELFASEGYERTSIRNIAARVGVSSTAIYVYFKDKDQLMYELCNSLFAGLLQGFQAVAQSDGAPLERFKRMMRAYVEWGLRNPREYRLLFMMPVSGIGIGHRPGPGVTKAPESDLGMQSFALFQLQVQGLMDSGHLRRMDSALAAEILWAGGHGLVSLLITHADFPWSPREALIEGMLAAQLQGMLTQA